MPNSRNNDATLPANPSLKDINQYKKRLNWGDTPPFYHLISQSISEAEYVLEHGFDSAIKRLIDQRNWNFNAPTMHSDNPKPRLALTHLFTERGFEIHAFAFEEDTPVNSFSQSNPKMEFIRWDPATMHLLVRINQLHKFIAFYFRNGDKADKALILHAHKIVHAIIEFLKQELNIVSCNGVSIKDFYLSCEKGLEDSDYETTMTSLLLQQPNKE